MENMASGDDMDFTTTMWDFTTNGTGTQSVFPPLQRSQLQVILGYVLTVIIAVVMIGMGCGVDIEKLKAHLKKPTGIIVGFTCQFVIMPAIAFALAKIAQLNDIQSIAILLVGSCPGGTSSNVATVYVNGDMSLSVSMTAISTTLGLGIMPLLLYIYSLGFNSDLIVPFDEIAIALAALIIPVVIGICIRFKFPQQAEKILKVLSVVGGIAILATVILLLISYGNSITITPEQIYIAAFFPGIGILLGYAISSTISLFPRLFLTHKQRRTICLETGIQNTQLGGAIIQLSFTFTQLKQTILVPVAYAVSQFVWIALIVIAYRVYFRKFKKVSSPANDFELDEEGSSQNEKSDYKDDGELGKGKSNASFEMDPPPYQQALKEQEVISDRL